MHSLQSELSIKDIFLQPKQQSFQSHVWNFLFVWTTSIIGMHELFTTSHVSWAG